MRVIIERIEVRKNNEEQFIALVERGRDRVLAKKFLAFRQIPEVVAELKATLGEMEVTFFDVSFENKEMADEHIGGFI